MKRIKETLAFLGFVLLATTSLLFLLELGARLVLKSSPTYEKVGLRNFSYDFHPWSFVRNTPGFRYKDTLRINSMGWRGPEWTRRKPAGVKRVLLLGDSTAFSSFEIYEKATIAGYLARFLSKATGQRWSALNMSVSGGTSQMSLAALAHDGTTYAPDAVVVLNGHNDNAAVFHEINRRPKFDIVSSGTHFSYGDLWDPRTGRSPRPLLLAGLLLNESHLFRWLSGKKSNEFFSFASASGGLPTIQTPNLLPYYVRTIVSMSQISKGLNAKFVHCLQPWMSFRRERRTRHVKGLVKQYKRSLRVNEIAMPALARALRRASSRTGFKFADLSRLLDNQDAFSDTVHMNCESKHVCKGNRKIARRMAEELLGRSLQHLRP